MILFRVEDMSCGHCVDAVTRAVQGVDAQATVDIDLAGRLVRIAPTTAQAGALADAIRGAGYTPVVTDADAAKGA